MTLPFKTAVDKNGQSKEAAQAADDLYNQIGGIKGQVVIVNHPRTRAYPGLRYVFVLQRAGCQNCLIGVRTDIDGRYKLNLGAGKYRLYCEDTDRTDLVRRGQPREVTVKPGLQDVEFDIELELPRNR